MSARDRPAKRRPDKADVVGRAQRLARSLDQAQQTRSWLAVLVATAQKFIDNQASKLGALVAYYAFASVFPLLLVAYTILDLIAHQNEQLADRLTTALNHYPVIGTHLGKTASQGLGKSGFALVIGILLTLYAGRGVAMAMQNAMNIVWGVPMYRRPKFPRSLLRSLGIIALIGPGEIVTIALSGIAGSSDLLGGVFARVAALAVSLVLNIALFWLGFRLATSREIDARDMRLGAVLAAIAWQVLQAIGGLFVGHTTNSAYGVFGIVLGLLTWFFVQAQITLFVVELDVVRARHLWPRSLDPPPLTEADMRAYQSYADAGLLRPELAVEVRQAPSAEQDRPPRRQ
jgi:inner membrane protein YhjD